MVKENGTDREAERPIGADGLRPWHSVSADEALHELESDRGRGLSSEEVARRHERYGYNELQERPRRPFLALLLEQLNNFLILILVAASLVSLLLGDYIEAAAIMAIVVLNSVLGVVQESKAEEALSALKKMTAPEARVVRDGFVRSVPARDVVPGDVLILETGNYVPADARLVESINLRIDEASLTGESVPVEKDASLVLPADAALGERVNLAYMGTVVTYGRGRALAAATGMRTEFGRIAEMIQSFEKEETPLQRRLDQLAHWLGIGCLVICAVVGVVGILRDTPLHLVATDGLGAYFSASNRIIVYMFLTAVSLAIAAVPEGLPAIVTMCLALGMREMVRRHALIRRLPAVETLGSATVICSDKTGTLTKNEMMAVRLYTAGVRISISGEGYQPEGELTEKGEPIDLSTAIEAYELLKAGVLCNDARLHRDEANGGAWRMVGDPTEGALVVAAAKVGLWRDQLERDNPRLAEIPFDAERKRMTTMHPDGDHFVAYTKGAPDLLLPLCDRILQNGREEPLTLDERHRISGANQELAGQALRVLAIAYRSMDQLPGRPNADEVERDMVFVGLIGLIDPARPEVKEAIQVARRAGIRSVMITGDYLNTAVAIAHELALVRPGARVLSGHELDALDDAQFEVIADDVDVYARVSPQHKVRIVEALKARGHVVAMTGDGVNDAPALKRANIGVAMGITGTDVSRETADMVLTDDNYASIVSAIEAGRIIYANIRKFVYYLLSCNMAEILTIFLGMITGLGIPLTPIQLLWLNLITDGAPALALGLEKGDPDIMDCPPRRPQEPIIDGAMLLGIAVQTVFIATATLLAFVVGLRSFGNVKDAQTMAFVTLSASELLRAYTARSELYSVFQIGLFSNRFMQLGVGSSLILLVLVVYVPFLNPVFNTFPLSAREWLVILPLIVLPSIAAELNKWVLRQRRQARNACGGS